MARRRALVGFLAVAFLLGGVVIGHSEKSWQVATSNAFLAGFFGALYTIGYRYLAHALPPDSWMDKLSGWSARHRKWLNPLAGFLTFLAFSAITEFPTPFGCLTAFLGGALAAGAVRRDGLTPISRPAPLRAPGYASDLLETVETSIERSRPTHAEPQVHLSTLVLTAAATLAVLLCGGYLLLRGTNSTNDGNRIVIIAVVVVNVTWAGLGLRLKASTRSIGTGLVWGVVATVVTTLGILNLN
jgi:hypothetical protein